MKILVFGATGYVGSHATRRLISAGHEVTGFVRSDEGVQRMKDLGAHSVQGSLDDLPAVLPMLSGYDAIVWAAQLMIPDEYRVVSAMLDALQGSGKTFICTTGTGLLAQRTDGEWSEDTFAEDEPFTPSRYIGARVETEKLVREAASRGIRTMVLRPPLIWGNGGSKVIADLHLSAAKTGAVCYIGRGLNLYSHVHVEDLAELYVLALERGVSGALYHSVAGEVNFRCIAETIARHLGVGTRSIGFAEAEQLWDKFTALIMFSSCSRTRSPRARRELGWQPHPDRVDILEEAVSPAYRQVPQTRKPASWVAPAGTASITTGSQSAQS